MSSDEKIFEILKAVCSTRDEEKTEKLKELLEVLDDSTL